MPEPYQEPRFSSNAADGETTPRQPPLGLKDPLLPPNVLGQNFLSPKFLSPLGAQPLGAGNSLAVPTQAYQITGYQTILSQILLFLLNLNYL
jgi:hypothetical protein